jgi:hypothetical protein
LQPYLGQEIRNVLETSFPGRCKIKTSIGGKKSPRVDLLGTNFWPDIEVSTVDGEPILAVEVKLARERSLPKSISATIGQCIIYKLKYPYVIGFIANQAKMDPRYDEYNKQFEGMLNKLELPLVIRSYK